VEPSPEALKRFRIFKGHMPSACIRSCRSPPLTSPSFAIRISRVISAFYFMRKHVAPQYWKFRRLNWQLEDFVRNSPRDNVQTKW